MGPDLIRDHSLGVNQQETLCELVSSCKGQSFDSNYFGEAKTLMRKGTMLVGQGLAVRRVKRRPGCVTAWANSSSVVSISVVKTTARSRRVKRGPGCVTAWSRVGSTQVYWSPLHHKPQTCNDQQSYTYYTAPICRQLIYYTHTQYNNKNIVYGISKKKCEDFGC